MTIMMFPAYIFHSNQSVMAGSIRPAGGELKMTSLSLSSLCHWANNRIVAYRWMARTRHIVLWCGKIDRIRVQRRACCRQTRRRISASGSGGRSPAPLSASASVLWGSWWSWAWCPRSSWCLAPDAYQSPAYTIYKDADCGAGTFWPKSATSKRDWFRLHYFFKSSYP